MEKNVILLPCLFAFLGLFCTLDAANVSDWCPLPTSLKSNYDYNWSSKSYEWSNTNTKSSFLQLVLSWSPTFCDSLSESARNREFQCRHAGHFNLIVHGLWPQAAKASSARHHPRNCRNEKQLNSTFIKRYFCMIPDEDLIQAEWEKHGSLDLIGKRIHLARLLGTCHYQTATDYYTATETLYKSLNIPEIQLLENITATKVKNAFLMNNPRLFSSSIKVSMNDQNRLKEINICYNLNHQFVSCYS